jgi:hypothetical protein
MNKFEHWWMKRIIRREVIQDYLHKERISYLYEIIYDACRDEFNEDNEVMLKSFLQDCFDDAAKKNFDYREYELKRKS